MKNITLIAPNYRPETGAAAQRIVSVAEELARRTWNVTVITQLPHYPQNKIYEGYDLRSPHRTEENGVKIIRLRPWIVSRESLVFRLLSELFFCLQALPHLLRVPSSIIVASSPYLFLGPLGLATSRLKGAKFLWDVRDLTWLYPRAAGKKTYGLDRPLEKLMLWVARHADALTTATEGLLTYFVRRPVRAMVFPNGVSEAWLDQLLTLPAPTFRDRPLVLYAGLLGYNQALSTVLEAASLLRETDFVLIGDGPERSKLENLISMRNLTNVSLVGYLTQEQLLERYHQATILVGHLRGDPIHRWSQPSKLWEYMATGRPVIYAGEGEAVAIVEEHELGLAVPPEQPEALASAIHQLIAQPERASALGRTGRAFVVNHRKRSVLIGQFIELLENLK